MSRSTTERPAASEGGGSRRYLAMIKKFPLRPIRDADELDRAVEAIDQLLDRDDLAPEEEDYLDVLSMLVEVFEESSDPEPVVAPADMLRHLIEAKGVTRTAVSAATGVKESTLSEILAGKRAVSRTAMRAFGDYFRVCPSVFL